MDQRSSRGEEVMAPCDLEQWRGSWQASSVLEWSLHSLLPEGVCLEAMKPSKLHVQIDSFTVEQQTSNSSPHLFRADLDMEWRDPPLLACQPDPLFWAPWPPSNACPSKWRSTWVAENSCFKTEITHFAGMKDHFMVVQRRLLSAKQMQVTARLQKGDLDEVGSCTAVFEKISPQGPAPVSWLRNHGGSLQTLAERQEVLQKMANLLSDNIDLLSSAQAQDRVVPARFDGTARMLLGAIEYYQALLPQWMEPEKLSDTCPESMKSGVDADWFVINEPKGVGVVIVPWNAPVTLACIPALGMLAAGNRVVIKTAELTPTVAAVYRRLCSKYLQGFVWVEEGGREAAERLIDEGADHLVFTGGAETAKIVAARCAQTLTPMTLELGGKSPAFIDNGLSDSMLDDVVREILETKVAKTGQFCCAHDYALVHEDMHDVFCEKLRAAIEALGEKRNILMIGRKHYEAVKSKLLEADVERIPPLQGRFVPDDLAMMLPFTGLLSPAASGSVWTSEIFGPVLPILRVADVHEAVAHVNSMVTGKPLIAYCYSENAANVDVFVQGVSAGNIAVNSGPQRFHMNFNVAFGGIGPSGTGVHMWGREALREFSNRKHVCLVKTGFARSYFSGPPGR